MSQDNPGARLASWGHLQAKAIVFLTMLLALAGVLLAENLPVSLFPNVDFPHIVVSADAGDMPADQMVAEVTRPLEKAVNAIPGVEAVTSTTGRGACDLSITFDWHVNMDKTFTLVQGDLNQVQTQLPAGVTLDIKRMRPSMYPVVGYSLTSDTLNQVQLKNIARFVMRPLLTRVPGVANLQIQGGEDREALVEVNPAKLQAYHLSLPQVTQAIADTNEIASVGKLEQHYQLYLTLVDGRYHTFDQIANTVVTSVHGVPVTVGDVATVKPSTAPQWIHITADRHEAVLLYAIQQPGGNTVAIEAGIEKALAGMKNKLPPGLKIGKFYDQADLVRGSMGSVRDSMAVGVVLGAIVLYLFLRSLPITIIAVVSVPLTIAISVILLTAVHESFNIMTLGGMAAAVGLVMDDAIVMVENIVHHLQHGAQSPLDATRRALAEQWKPFIGSSLSSVIVFLPLAFLTGVTGAFFRSLSLTMACALVISLVLAVLVVPLAIGRFVKASSVPEHGNDGPIARGYRRTMRTLFARRWIVGLVAVAMLAGAATLYKTLPNGFLPEMDEGAVTLDYYTDPGTSLSETARVLKQVEARILATPEVASYSLRT
ncbi:MAG TPA: efflux RND transporter permease subunit, partial [Oscillatoriaceae cyanobacterium]